MNSHYEVVDTVLSADVVRLQVGAQHIRSYTVLLQGVQEMLIAEV
jgi:hypothetical protein